MDYQEALAFIKEATKFGIKLGLARMREILKRLAHPEKKFKAIHLAGTNGKGSTTALLESVLRTAGYKTARYTSPHLSSYRERFVINGELIKKETLAEIVTEIRPVLLEVAADGFGKPTEFEVGTVIAFVYFARAQVDFALIEVGMGGRLDATNVLEPLLCIITKIALDHQQYLGDTLTEIAFEKAGIIKPNIPVVIGTQVAEIAFFLKEIAKERKAPFKLVDNSQIKELRVTEKSTIIQIAQNEVVDNCLELGLLGQHQGSNALNVLAGVAFLRQAGWPIEKEAIQAGLKAASWPGRVELIDSFLPRKLYLDGAHNPDGVRALVATLKAIYPGQKFSFLIGVLDNRPLAEMAALLAPGAARVLVTRVPDPKSAKIEELAEIFTDLGVAVEAIADPLVALKRLFNFDANQVAVITGSLYLTGLLRQELLGGNGSGK